MEKIIGLKELRENVSKYAAEVDRGKSFIVMKKSKPLFKISQPENESEWETVVDFTKFSKKGISAKKLLNYLLLQTIEEKEDVAELKRLKKQKNEFVDFEEYLKKGV